MNVTTTNAYRRIEPILLQRRQDYAHRLQTLVLNNASFLDGAHYLLGGALTMGGGAMTILSGTVIIAFGDEASGWVAKGLLAKGFFFTLIGLSSTAYGTIKVCVGLARILIDITHPTAEN